MQNCTSKTSCLGLKIPSRFAFWDFYGWFLCQTSLSKWDHLTSLGQPHPSPKVHLAEARCQSEVCYMRIVHYEYVPIGKTFKECYINLPPPSKHLQDALRCKHLKKHKQGEWHINPSWQSLPIRWEFRLCFEGLSPRLKLDFSDLSQSRPGTQTALLSHKNTEILRFMQGGILVIS